MDAPILAGWCFQAVCQVGSAEIPPGGDVCRGGRPAIGFISRKLSGRAGRAFTLIVTGLPAATSNVVKSVRLCQVRA